MKTLRTSTILRLSGKMEAPAIARPSRTRFTGRSLGFAVIFALIIAAAFYTASSASSSRKVSRNELPSPATSFNPAGDTNAAKRVRGLLPALMSVPGPVQAIGDESVATFQVVSGLCTAVAKSSFLLGEQVCVRVENAPLRAGAPLRRINFTGPAGFVRDTADVVTNPQQTVFTLPLANTSVVDGVTIDNRGTWSASSNATSDGGVRAIAYFKVSDPANAAADLVVYDFSTDENPVEPGTSTGFFLWLSNNGPDGALNAHVTQAVPPNMAYVSATTTSAFTCTVNAGVVDCVLLPATIWPSGAIATITLNYTVSGAAPNGVISSTANISSDTNDPRPANNSSSAQVEVRSAGGTPATCSLGCPGNMTVTADTTEGGVRGAHVTFAGSVEVSGDCGTIGFSPASGSFFPEGTNAVSVTSSAGGGSCSFTITVIDTDAPTITCPPDKTAQAPAGTTEASVDPGTPTATGNGVSVSGTRSDNDCHPEPGEPCNRELNDPYPVGVTIITWTATDADQRTASCQQRITVTSDDAFTISCPPDRTFTASDCTGYTATASEIGSPTTNGGAPPVVIVGHRSDSLDLYNDPYPPGQTIITWTATDNVGRVVSCSQAINVNSASGADTTPPTLQVPPDVSATTSTCSATLDDELGVATAEDNCSTTTISRSGVPTFACPTPSDPNKRCESFVFPTGTTVITYTARDEAGNTTVGTQNVTVTEDPAVNPTIAAPADSSASADANCQAPVPDYTAGSTASDNCGSVTLSQSPTAGTLVGYGPHTVTVTATDPSGNTASDQVVFTVNDTTAPTVTAPADSSANADANCQAAVPDYTAGTTAADNCGTATLSQSPAAGTMVGYGPHTVTVTANDGHGNTSSDDVVFTVNDVTPPTITAPADSSAYADANCQAPVPDYRPGTVAADNCGTATLSQTPAPGTLVGYGPHTITVTANDGHGNTASDDVVFTVNDNTPPVFTSCPSNITLESTCPTGAVATYATPTATDNCGVTVSRTAGGASGSVFPIGTTTVTHVADDGHGNTATCTFTVTVQTPQVVIQNLINSVNGSSLSPSSKGGLVGKLEAALDAINQGKTNVACNKLDAFVNSVQNLISHGDISAAQGNAWINSANHVRNTIGCTNLPCS